MAWAAIVTVFLPAMIQDERVESVEKGEIEIINEWRGWEKRRDISDRCGVNLTFTPSSSLTYILFPAPILQGS